ncbi:MAG TPA: LLM class F420-dependent oxidoreductase [Candidatus Limnocylindrales bacterium]|nr:LLM class F420-dependent oxidoreductase [Candidatus Limnocylindrales bacterium]
MKLGLQIPSFTWPGGDAAIGPTLARIVRTADEVGFDSIWVMDHFWQIRSVGQAEEPMLEGMTTLGFAAGLTRRARLGLMVGGIHYRQPGLWAKATTTLDVLTGGRAYLGIGAAWNEAESRGLGFPFPPLRERFERLEDTLRFVTEMWQGERGSEAAFSGHALIAERTLNSPQVLSRPHPPIMVGGGGEQVTLRLVARYADACNVFGGPDMLRHKYAVLRRHCEAVGRDFATIERSNLNSIALAEDGGSRADERTVTPGQLVERIGSWAEAGSQHAIFSLRDVHDVARLERIGRDVIPQVRALGDPSPIP